MSTGDNSTASSGQVKTFRGRSIEEILPQIRAELGPDAIILREREGLVGGVGGFFAQRLIEVDARRADGQSIDIYDDTGSDDLADLLGLPQSVAGDGQPEPWPASERDERGSNPVDGATETQPPPPSAGPNRFETGLFLDRLREASQALPDDAELTVPGPPPERTDAGTVDAHPIPETSAPVEPEAQPEPESRQQTTSEDEQAAPPRGARGTRERPTRTKPQRASKSSDQTQDTRPRQPPTSRRSRTDNDEERRSPAEPTPSANPYESVRPRPPIPVDDEASSSSSRRARTPVPAAFATPPTTPGSPAAPASRSDTSRRSQQTRGTQSAPRNAEPVREPRRGTFSRLLEGWRRPAPTPPPAPAAHAELTEVHDAVRFLAERGASEEWASQVINAAAAHAIPLAQGLHEAARAEVARRILSAPSLPATGAAIAFIGAGGSGKTRCTAALASAYNRVSTLSVTVVTIDNSNGAGELRQLLREEQIPILSLTEEQARQTIETNRRGGLVIVDTDTCTPTDPVAVSALASQLAGLQLDAVYVALPATLGAGAARRALSSFAALRPTAVVVTHADETDQLAVVVELATTHRIPLAYLHSGTDPHTALSPVDPRDIALDLIP